MNRPAPADVRRDPQYWITGPGRDAAHDTDCEHGYRLTDSCPACDAEETADQDHVDPGVHMIEAVPLADVRVFAETLRAALTLSSGADCWELSARMAEVRGSLAAVAFDGCTPANAARVLDRITRRETGR